MTINPELKGLETPELSEEELAIQNSQEEIDDLKDELPITREEAAEACDAMEDIMNVMEKAIRPFKVLSEEIADGIKLAKQKWNLKWTEKEVEKAKNIITNAMKALEENPGEARNLIVRSEETNQYYLNPDWFFDFINNKMDKKDRKFIKKVIKAILKTRKQEKYEEIKAEKKDAKERNRMRKKYFVDSIK